MPMRGKTPSSSARVGSKTEEKVVRMIRGVSNLDLSRMLVLDAPRFPRRALGRVSSLHGHVRAQALNGFAEKL